METRASTTAMTRRVRSQRRIPNRAGRADGGGLPFLCSSQCHGLFLTSLLAPPLSDPTEGESEASNEPKGAA